MKLSFTVTCERLDAPSLIIERSVSDLPDGYDIQGFLLNDTLEAYDIFKSEFGRPSVIIIEIDEEENEKL